MEPALVTRFFHFDEFVCSRVWLVFVRLLRSQRVGGVFSLFLVLFLLRFYFLLLTLLQMSPFPLAFACLHPAPAPFAMAFSTLWSVSLCHAWF